MKRKEEARVSKYNSLIANLTKDEARQIVNHFETKAKSVNAIYGDQTAASEAVNNYKKALKVLLEGGEINFGVQLHRICNSGITVPYINGEYIEQLIAGKDAGEATDLRHLLEVKGYSLSEDEQNDNSIANFLKISLGANSN